MSFVTPSGGLRGPVAEQHLDGGNEAFDVSAQCHQIGSLGGGDPVGIGIGEIPPDVPASGLEGSHEHESSLA